MLLNRFRKFLKLKLRLLPLLVATIFAFAGLWSCSNKQLPSMPPQTQFHQRVDIQHDTVTKFVWIKDSTLYRDTVRIMVKGDTVFRDVIKWRFIWRIRADTVTKYRNRYITVHDSIDRPVPYPVEKKVYIEKDLSAWQKFRLAAFWPFIAALAAALIYIFRKPLVKLLFKF